MQPVHSFPPLSRADARLLILGSMPGRRSLQEQQYYAHPRNAFWTITGALFGFRATDSYQQRTTALLRSRVALWDVMASCVRPSSLDSDIVESSVEFNDFDAFLARHPQVGTIACNGLKAGNSFRKRVFPGLQAHSGIQLIQLPSTSPAHARLSVEDKLQQWSAALAPLVEN
jgi:TDG/mug DNA glycosylase family protein